MNVVDRMFPMDAELMSLPGILPVYIGREFKLTDVMRIFVDNVDQLLPLRFIKNELRLTKRHQNPYQFIKYPVLKLAVAGIVEQLRTVECNRYILHRATYEQLVAKAMRIESAIAAVPPPVVDTSIVPGGVVSIVSAPVVDTSIVPDDTASAVPAPIVDTSVVPGDTFSTFDLLLNSAEASNNTVVDFVADHPSETASAAFLAPEVDERAPSNIDATLDNFSFADNRDSQPINNQPTMIDEVDFNNQTMVSLRDPQPLNNHSFRPPSNRRRHNITVDVGHPYRRNAGASQSSELRSHSHSSRRYHPRSNNSQSGSTMNARHLVLEEYAQRRMQLDEKMKRVLHAMDQQQMDDGSTFVSFQASYLSKHMSVSRFGM